MGRVLTSSVPLQTKSSNGRLPGQLHYENLCMKAVNQSIGMKLFKLQHVDVESLFGTFLHSLAKKTLVDLKAQETRLLCPRGNPF